MSNTMVPLSEVITLLADRLAVQHKQATALDADTKADIPVKDERNESTDVVVKDTKLNPTDNQAAATEMAEGVAPVVSDYTTTSDDTLAKDESSAVETERGSEKPSVTDKLAALICTVLDSGE